MKKLLIDTSDSKTIKVGVRIKDKVEFLSSDSKLLKSEAVIRLIDNLLKKKNLEIKVLEKIEVNTGPGSFTGLRVGVAIANALSYILKIPVNDKKVGDFVEPMYN